MALRLLHSGSQIILFARNSSSKASYIHRIENDPLKYLTIGQLLKQSSIKYADKQAVVSCAEKSTLTFAQAIEKVNR
jgi:hypothetical protein